MQLPEFNMVDLSQMTSWLPVLVGGLAAGLIVLLARRWLTSSSATATPPAAASAPESLPLDPVAACLVERRANARYTSPSTEVVVADSEKSNECLAELLDRGRGGLAVLLPSSVKPGTKLRFRLANAATNLRWINVQVRYCQSNGRRWRMGGEFVDSPGLSAQLLDASKRRAPATTSVLQVPGR